MPRKAQQIIAWTSCRGRNGFDAPSQLPDDMAAEAFDVIFQSRMPQKRKGTATQTITGTFTNYYALGRFIPGQNDTAAELFIVSGDATPKILRVAAGTAASNLTLADNFSSNNGYLCTFATLNGKFYISYKAGVNRLHVFDPHISSTVVRRSGLAKPGAPTVANTGGGTYAATPRYYEVQWVTQVAGTLQRASNLGAPVSFTPSGAGTAARITRPSAPGEGETHWRVYGSADGDEYFLLSTSDIAIGTTTYDDSVLPSNYDDGDPAPAFGAFTPFPSVKYLLSTGDRLLGFGSWETTAGDSVFPRNGRVWHTPVLDSSDYDDDERIDQTLGWYTDVSRDAGAEDRGIVGPLDNQILVGQSRGLYILIPTGSADVPYRRIVLSTALGMVSHQSSFLGEDEFGRPCIYFLDPTKGPYRYGADGLQWCGFDVQDVWDDVSLSEPVWPHGVYDPAARRVIWWVCTTAGTGNPTTVITFDVREGKATETEGVRYGWSRWTMTANTGISSVIFPMTFGNPMSRKMRPYSGAASLSRYDDDSSTTLSGASFQAYVTSKAYTAEALNRMKRIDQAYIQASATNAPDLQLTVSRDYDRERRVVVTTLATANRSQTRVRGKFESLAIADCFAIQFTIGDPTANANTWVIDHIIVPFEIDEEDR